MTDRQRTRSARFPLRVRDDPWLYAVARILLVPLVLVYGRFSVVGAAHVPARGPVLVVANHPSDVDPILVAIAVRRPLRFMADAVQFRRGFVGTVIRLLGAFPVHLDRPDVTAVRQALALLEAGEAVAIFPEGDVVRQSRPGAFHRGVGLLAERSGAPVVPVAIAGAERLWRDGRLHWPAIEVSFGPPVQFGDMRPEADDHDSLAQAVRAAVTDLLSRAA